MTIGLALGNAVTGLAAASRGIELVSSNVANAQTEGYAARELITSSRTIDGRGSGVQIDGIRRRVDEALLYDRRQSDGALAQAQTHANALAELEGILGDPTEAGSLSQRVAQLSSDLLAASSRPDSNGRLESAVRSASGLAQFLNEAADEVQGARRAADQAIAKDVETLNAALSQVAELDDEIGKLAIGGRDVSGLLDQRQIALDTIAEIVPVREIARENGRIAIYTMGGAALYEGHPTEITFSQTYSLTADQTYSDGDLSGVVIGGLEISASSNASRIQGGRLFANFQVRDEVAPEAQTALDAFARDLVERFQDPTLDDTLVAGDPGLFTDRGAAFDPADEVGLANRIALHTAVDPDQGGEAWRLRDGLNALASGNVGNGGLLTSLQGRLSEPLTVASGPAAGTTLSTAEFAAEVSSLFASKTVNADRAVTYERARHESLTQAELRNGVDTDDELRQLLVLEQAYEANARIISVLGELMQTLLRI